VGRECEKMEGRGERRVGGWEREEWGEVRGGRGEEGEESVERGEGGGIGESRERRE
jgi:hypothetical protein